MHKEFSSTPDLKKNIYSTSSHALSQNGGDSQSNKNQPFGAAFQNSQTGDINTAKTSNSSSNVNSDLASDHLTDTRLLLNGMDSRVGHQRGYYTLPSRHKKVTKSFNTCIYNVNNQDFLIILALYYFSGI